MNSSDAALPPPPGQQSNFTDPPSIQPAIIAGLTVCLIVSTISVVVRCYAQWSLFKNLIWADAWMLLGWAFQVAFAAFLYACLPYGAGRDQWNVTKSNFSQINFLLFVDFVLYDFAILGPKVSILLQLKAIFVPHGRGNGRTATIFFWAALSLIAVNIIFYVALSFALIFQCSPVEKGWNSSVEGTCLDQDSLLESSGPFNIISDFLMFLLPLLGVWQLRLPIKTRLGVASAFAVGLFGCVCSAVRLYYSNRLDSSGNATLLIFQNQLWANAEITTGLLIANIIIVPRFIRFKRGIPSSGGYATGSASRNYALSGSKGFQRRSTLTQQRRNTGDPYIELSDTTPSTQSRQEFHFDDDQKSAEAGKGIMRTVQIDTSVEEAVSPRSRPGTENHLVNVVTGNHAR